MALYRSLPLTPVGGDIMAWGRITLAVGGLMLATACADKTIQSEPLTAAPDPNKGESGGLVYALPKTMIKVSASYDSKENKVNYSVTPLTVPDAHARYRLRYAASAWSEDELTLSVDSNGLLNTANKSKSTDHTGDVVVSVAKTLATAANFYRAQIFLRQDVTPAPPDKITKNPYPYDISFDVEQLINNNKSLPDDATIRIESDGWLINEPNGKSPSCEFSVCFRTVVPIKVILKPDRDGSREIDYNFVAFDPHRTDGIDYHTASLATRTNTVTFQNGAVASVEVIKPSSARLLATTRG